MPPKTCATCKYFQENAFHRSGSCAWAQSNLPLTMQKLFGPFGINNLGEVYPEWKNCPTHVFRGDNVR